MRVLIVSHNSLNNESNMGKTLISYFSGFNDSQLAQFYVCDEEPDNNICSNYYRITDKEALKSIVTRKCGSIIDNCSTVKKINNNKKNIKKNAIIHFLRDFVWYFSNWFNMHFKQWIDAFNPDIVFLASGDYSFIYNIALKISIYKNIPLVVNCMDDYYLNNQHSKEMLGKTYHKFFMKTVNKTINYCSCLVTISEMMNQDYSKKFNKKCYTLHTSTNIKSKNLVKDKFISYVGNLGLGRAETIVKIGKTLKKLYIGEEKKYIDVYSKETDGKILSLLSEENNIRFHGAITAAEVPEVLYKSEYLLHVESFEKKYIDRVKYSVSTKIPDSLASGSILIAVGPINIASIAYLKNNNIALIVDEIENIDKILPKFIECDNLKSIIMKNSLNIVEKNHREFLNKKLIYEIFNNVIKRL